MSEKEYWLGFSLFPGIGPKKFTLLLETFGSAKDAWVASQKEILKVLGPALTEKFLLFRERDNLSQLAQRITSLQTNYVALYEEEYPQLLKKSVNPPSVLYIKGNLDIFTNEKVPTIGIVGTRKITSYGRRVTEMITRDLVESGSVIVSGLAMGVDAVAHQTTIDTGGKTIAVLGCGIECCHPSTNTTLYDDIIKSGGAVVSEFPFDMAPTKGSFPSRNRIIAGLSQAIIVTEGAADSGALITAKDAFENKRCVFAVPGPITSSLSKGPNSLLSKGAKIVTNGQDILRELGLGGNKRDRRVKKITGETEEEQRIIDVLENETLSFDEIVRLVGLDPSKVGTILSIMEMNGIIENTGSRYILI